MEDVEGIYLLAYRRQLLSLAWHFSTSNFGLSTAFIKLGIEPDHYISKVESLFERYLKQWEDGKPLGPHNVPRRGQLRETTQKRSFKQLVEHQKKSECSGSGYSE